ncbi:MAG: hypothetical protein KI790_21370 [Cyclobacteriaceae bacterium]|nr:hypothetical protein [Cyclobacteriaceae bacterium HetDA_MAG_MS6]
MRYRSIFYLGLIMSVSGLQAQDEYLQSAGVRLGHTSAITYKKFLAENEAIELLVSGRREGMQTTLLYTQHIPMQFSFNQNFYAFYGLGGHLGFEQYDNLNKTLTSLDPPEFVFEEKGYFVMGVDAIIGIEYRWLSVPATIGFDVKPYFNFIGMRYGRARFWDAAISFKYVF